MSIVINHPNINNQSWELDATYSATDTKSRSNDEWRAYLNGSLNRIEYTNAFGSSEVFLGLDYDTTYTWYMEMWYQDILIDTSDVETFRTESVPGSESDPPEKAIAPGPINDETDVSRATNLTWRPGNASVNDYDVYFGTVGNMVLVAINVTNEFFDIHDYSGGLSLGVEYEWRIDSFDAASNKATGDTWSYTTRVQRTVILSSPANGAIDKLQQFLIEWTIDGIGAQYGSFEDQDFLFIYIRKDDANFTEDDLVANFVQAFYNDELTISRLQYGATYYWQVQAGNTAADLTDSEVWSFTMLDFLPPVVPLNSGGEPIGINNMLTRKRFIAAANNKIWYEDI